MEQLNYSERFLYFIRWSWQLQINEGTIYQAYVFKSDCHCPIHNYYELESELKNALIYGNETALKKRISSIKTLIKELDKLGKIMLQMQHDRKIVKGYFNYTYSDGSFGLQIIAPDVKFKHSTSHDWKQIGVYFTNVYKLLENLFPDKAKPEPDPLPNLEAIFADKNNLVKLVKLLKDKKFVSEEAGRLFWIKKPVEFAAMAKTCLPLIKREHQEPTILHNAWTSLFFDKKKMPKDIVSPQYFKTKAKENEIHPHLEKFIFINRFFDIE